MCCEDAACSLVFISSQKIVGLKGTTGHILFWINQLFSPQNLCFFGEFAPLLSGAMISRLPWIAKTSCQREMKLSSPYPNTSSIFPPTQALSTSACLEAANTTWEDDLLGHEFEPWETVRFSFLVSRTVLLWYHHGWGFKALRREFVVKSVQPYIGTEKSTSNKYSKTMKYWGKAYSTLKTNQSHQPFKEAKHNTFF